MYVALAKGQLVGASYPRVQFQLPLRRVFLERFPFAVVFYVEEEDVHVVAVEALRKKPGYWHARLR